MIVRILASIGLLLSAIPAALWAQGPADNPPPPISFTLDGDLTIGQRRVLSISGLDAALQARSQSLEFSWGRVKPALCRPDYGTVGAVSLTDAERLSVVSGSAPNIGISYQDRALVCYVARLRYVGVLQSDNSRVDQDALVGAALLWRSATATEEVVPGGGESMGERFRKAFVGRLGPTLTILIFTPVIGAFLQWRVKKPALSLGVSAAWLVLGTFFFGASGWLLFLTLPLVFLAILAVRFSR